MSQLNRPDFKRSNLNPSQEFEYTKHRKLHQRLEEAILNYNKQKYLSLDDERRKKKYQKEKLMHKDRMQAILGQHA